MAERKESVQLELDLGDLERKAPQAVVIIDDMGKVVGELDRDLGGLDRTVEETGRDMAKTAAETGLLNVELAKARDRSAQLRAELDRTGDLSLLKQIRQARSDVVQLERVTKEFENTATGNKGGLLGRIFGGSFFGGKSIPNSAIKDMESAGAELGEVFSGGFIQIAGKLLIAFAPILIPIVAGIASTVVAAIGGALATGLGAGGLAVGIVGALQDPKVKAAAEGVGGSLKTALTAAGSSFVEPLTGALRSFDIFVQGEGSKLTEVFAPLAAVLGNVERGVEGFVTAALPGFTDGFRRAAPLVALLGEQMPKLGKAFGDFVEKITSSEAGNRAALVMIVDVVDKIIEGLGNLFQAGSHTFAGLVRFVTPIAHVLDDIFSALGKIPLLGAAYKVLGGPIHSARTEVDDLNAALSEQPDAIDESSAAAKQFTGNLKSTAEMEQLTADRAKELNDAFDKLFGSAMSLDTANLKYQQGLIAISQSLKDNGNSLDITKEKGQANLQVIEQQISNIKDLRDAQVANGIAVDDANAKYDQNLTALENTLVQLGFNKKAVDELIGKYKAIPGNVTTTVSVLGLDAATYQIEGVTKRLNALDDRIVSTYVVVNTVTGQEQTITKSSRPFRASGGPVYAGQDYVIGENGPEFFRPSVNGYIFPNSYYNSQMAQNGGRYMLGTPPAVSAPASTVNVYVSAKDGASQAIMDLVDVRIEHADRRTAAAVSGGVRL